MRKITLLICSMLFLFSSVAFASLDDTKLTIEKQYGDYRLLIDSDNQLWTKADWEARGSKKAKAASYRYSFSRQGIGVQMEVMYANNKPDALVVAQRFTPDMPITIKEMKKYFPEVYALTKAPKANFFATYSSISRNFQEGQSPVSMGVLIRELTNGNYYSLLAFNVQDEGRLLKNIEYISEDTYIREFTIERASRTTVHDAMDTSKPDWQPIKNYFN
ncbi:hypothetical protein [Pelosinus sp. IPA-1]|uniref:hypothetical protein n=1 Tax=Pelosinus sp. IPA-1 TaxID=3029569 RepID=UPI0024362943|nr:hypothetical protein [Pelosinus sp. IPA-1]GMB01932.1 hypothetical protein PIPA1_47320 [Pelosinus sp. IPA-1]